MQKLVWIKKGYKQQNAVYNMSKNSKTNISFLQTLSMTFTCTPVRVTRIGKLKYTRTVFEWIHVSTWKCVLMY